MVFFLIAEVIAIFLLPKPRVKKAPQVKHIPAATLGWLIEPAQQAYTFSFPVTINSQGWRYREFSAQKPSGVTRILCLGDSFTFGAGVRTEDTYPAQLEALLNQVPSEPKFEVINMGVYGYGTRQEVDLLKKRGLQYQPDVVIIGMYANDPYDTLRYYKFHENLQKVSPSDIPHNDNVQVSPTKGIESTEDNESNVSQSETGWFRKFVLTHIRGKRLLPISLMYALQHSRLAYFVGWRINRLVERESLEPEILSGQETPEVLEAWAKIEESLQDAVKLSREHQFRIMLIVFPNPQQLVQEFPHAKYQTVVKELARQWDIPYLDLFSAYQQAYTTFESLFIPYDGHPNEKAYQITVREISAYLQSDFSL